MKLDSHNYALAEQLERTKGEAKRLEAQCAAMRKFVMRFNGCQSIRPQPQWYTKAADELLHSTIAGQDLLAQMERYETSISLAIPVLAQVSKACCDMADWDQIDGDRVNAALNACREALKGTPRRR